MITKNPPAPLVALMGLLFAFPLSATAAKTQAEFPLNSRGTALLEQYAKQLEALRAEVVAALPPVEKATKSRFLEVRAKWNGLPVTDDETPPAERKAQEELREQTQTAVMDAAGVLLAELASD